MTEKNNKQTSLVPQQKMESICAVMDRRDTALILQQMRGQLVEEYVYQFKDKGHLVRQFTAVGIDWASEEMAKRTDEVIRIIKSEYKYDDKNYFFEVTAGRYLVNKQTGHEVLLDTTTGRKREPINKPKRDGSGYRYDKFAFETGGRKAERNAKRQLLNQILIANLIDIALKEKKIVDITEEVKQIEKEEKALPKNNKPTKPKTDSPKVNYKNKPTKEQMAILGKILVDNCKVKPEDKKRMLLYLVIEKGSTAQDASVIIDVFNGDDKDAMKMKEKELVMSYMDALSTSIFDGEMPQEYKDLTKEYV